MATDAAPTKSNSRLERVVSPALDKVVKNAAWRKHNKLVTDCKAAIEKLAANDAEVPSSSVQSALYEDNGLCYSGLFAEYMVRPLIGACQTAYPRVVEPALDCIQKLIAHGHLRGEMDALAPDNKLLAEVCANMQDTL